jgi:hypothetical protein
MSRQDKNTKKKKAEDLLSFFFPSGGRFCCGKKSPCINFKIYTRAYPYGCSAGFGPNKEKKKIKERKRPNFLRKQIEKNSTDIPVLFFFFYKIFWHSIAKKLCKKQLLSKRLRLLVFFRTTFYFREFTDKFFCT